MRVRIPPWRTRRGGKPLYRPGEVSLLLVLWLSLRRSRSCAHWYNASVCGVYTTLYGLARVFAGEELTARTGMQRGEAGKLEVTVEDAMAAGCQERGFWAAKGSGVWVCCTACERTIEWGRMLGSSTRSIWESRRHYEKDVKKEACVCHDDQRPLAIEIACIVGRP